LNLEGLQPIEGRAFWSGMPDPTRKYLWTAFGDVREVDFDAGSVTLQAGQSHPVHDEHKGEWSEAPEISIHSLDQLTDPGEFWIEAETALAYLILPGPHDPEETRISVCDAPLVTLEGDGITWRGIDVKQGRGDGLVVNGANCRVEECRLNNHKREGLRVHGVRVRVTGCEITGNGYRGARCNSGPGGNNTDPGDRGNCVLQRNEIHANGRLMARNPQLAIYGSGHIVRDNDIHTGGAALVKLGGYFVTLENNRLIDGCLWCADYGAVYGMDTDPNKTPEAELKNRRYAVIRGNRFENIRRTVPNFYTNQAIYLDHQYTGAYIENNTFVRVQVPWRTYGSMVIRGNHCIDCLLPGGSYNRLGEHMEFVFEDNTWEGPDPVYDYATMGQGTSGLRIKGSIHRAAEDVPIETVRD
jgi:hypothetical protein